MVDFSASADLFPNSRITGRRRALKFRRFEEACDAVRYAIEELPSGSLNGTYLQVDDSRYDAAGIQRLYDSADYPLVRKAAE